MTKIDKSKIVKCASMGFLYLAASAIIGIEFQDSQFDHRQEVCPLGKLNVFHQINEMEKDYLEKDKRVVEFHYEKDYFEEENRYAYVKTLPDGSLDYEIPDGYVVDENFLVKKIDGEYGAIVPDKENEDIEVMRVK